MTIWRYSPKDLALVSVAIGQFAVTTAWAMAFQGMSLAANAAAFLAITYVFYFNPVVVTHNFLHTPFFRRRLANRAFAVFNSANLFLPQVLYKYHHLAHHQYANDPVANNTTQDPSSTYRYGQNGRQESFLRYCALSLFRDGGTGEAFREAMRHGQRTQFALELAGVVVAGGIWLAIDWRWMLFAYLPTFYFGWFLALLENYFEHHRARDHRNRLADSVSYYGHWYNVLMFNEGYHQEHHLKPHLHWTRRPEVYREYRAQFKEAGAYEARMPPILGFFD